VKRKRKKPIQRDINRYKTAKTHKNTRYTGFSRRIIQPENSTFCTKDQADFSGLASRILGSIGNPFMSHSNCFGDMALA